LTISRESRFCRNPRNAGFNSTSCHVFISGKGGRRGKRKEKKSKFLRKNEKRRNFGEKKIKLVEKSEKVETGWLRYKTIYGRN
jgi:hypothetical protein